MLYTLLARRLTFRKPVSVPAPDRVSRLLPEDQGLARCPGSCALRETVCLSARIHYRTARHVRRQHVKMFKNHVTPSAKCPKFVPFAGMCPEMFQCVRKCVHVFRSSVRHGLQVLFVVGSLVEGHLRTGTDELVSLMVSADGREELWLHGKQNGTLAEMRSQSPHHKVAAASFSPADMRYVSFLARGLSDLLCLFIFKHRYDIKIIF